MVHAVKATCINKFWSSDKTAAMYNIMSDISITKKYCVFCKAKTDPNCFTDNETVCFR